jgi:hypothetical protein
MSVAAVAALTKSQIIDLSDDAIEGITSDQGKALTTDQVEAFTRTVLSITQTNTVNNGNKTWEIKALTTNKIQEKFN